MASYQHQNLAAGHWQTLSLAEQLGNVGSEVGRALSWQKRGNEEQKDRAIVRGLELLDLTLAAGHSGPRLKEIARTREVVADYFFGDNRYSSTPATLENYFYHFALLARRGR